VLSEFDTGWYASEKARAGTRRHREDDDTGDSLLLQRSFIMARHSHSSRRQLRCMVQAVTSVLSPR